jgi:hypothetical protein
VRPDQFGFYPTRWRSWPGQGVKQVGHFDPATTPVVPPRSEVPDMEDELALPSQRDEAAPDEEEEEEAMADVADDDEAAAGDAKPAEGAGGASGAEGGLPDGADSAPSASDSEDAEEKSGDGAATPSKASGPLEVPLETSSAEAARPAGALTAGAWSNWSRSSLADPKQAPPGSVVRTSAPAETTEAEGSSDERRDGSKLRSPAQRMVEGSERAVGRWRAKAAAPAETSVEAAANPLRGVTAQPGNPLR